MNRVLCKTEGCLHTILPATAAANNGHCMPCVHKRIREERERYILERRREVDPYAGVDDPVDLIKIYHTPRQYDPLIVYRPAPIPITDLYQDLTSSQAIGLMSHAKEAFGPEQVHRAKNIAQYLAVFTDFNIDSILQTLIEAGELSVSVSFRNAGENIRDQIIQQIETGNSKLPAALRALAWIGDGVVQEKFRVWEHFPVPAQDQLHVPLSAYTLDAGWVQTDTGRADLFYKDCFAITPAPEAAANEKLLKVMIAQQDRCPACALNLHHMFAFKNDGQFGAIQASPFPTLAILTCHYCTAFSNGYFARVNSDGSTSITPEHTRIRLQRQPSLDDHQIPWTNMPVSLNKRSPRFAVDWCMEVGASQIGGMPTWIQDVTYPSCPDCSKRMMFLGQLDNEQFLHWEGIYYAFHCPTCFTTATVYQQS